MTSCCDMRGFLRFLILRLISKKNMSGEDLRKELEKRKGSRPSPGTIYPVIKVLKQNKLIEEVDGDGKEKKYTITTQGKKELKLATKKFITMFCCMGDEFHKHK